MSKRKLLAKISKIYAILMEKGPGGVDEATFKGIIMSLEDMMQEIFNGETQDTGM